MSVLIAVKVYLALNFLIALACLLLSGLTLMGRRFSRCISYGHLLQLSYVLIAVSLVAPFALSPSKSETIWTPKAQVWHAIESKIQSSDLDDAKERAVVSIGSLTMPVQSESVAAVLRVLLGFGFAFVGCRLWADARALQAILRRSFVVKRIGRVSVLACDDPVMPFAARDVWELIRSGYENDPRYVASVVATVLIMKNPDSLVD